MHRPVDDSKEREFALPGRVRKGLKEVTLELSLERLVLKDGVFARLTDVEEEGKELPWAGAGGGGAEEGIAGAKRMQTWKSLVTEGTARNSVGKSAGLCGHVTWSGTRLFQEEDRKTREAARLCCNTPQQTTTGPVDTAADFFFFF